MILINSVQATSWNWCASNEGPCDGHFYVMDRYLAGGSSRKFITLGYGMIWDSARQKKMDGNERLDMSLEENNCNGGVRPVDYAGIILTNIPNSGVDPKNDGCGSLVTEVELKIQDSIVVGKSYYMQLEWNCLVYGNWDFKLTFQEKNNGGHRQLGTYDNYLCDPTSRSANDQRLLDESMFHIENQQIITETLLLHEDYLNEYNYTVYQTGDFYDVDIINQFNSMSDVEILNVTNRQLIISLENDWAKNTERSDTQVMVVMTFNTPLSYNESVELFSQLDNFQATQYAVFGKENGDVVSTYFEADSGRIEPFSLSVPTERGTVINDGIMMISGLVSMSSIDQLGNNPNIALLDITASIVQQEIYEDFGIDISVEDIFVPNPSWIVYTESAIPTTVQLTNYSTTSIGLLRIVIIIVGLLLILTIRCRNHCV